MRGMPSVIDPAGPQASSSAAQWLMLWMMVEHGTESRSREVNDRADNGSQSLAQMPFVADLQDLTEILGFSASVPVILCLR
jgi:hypothetical protein